MKITLDIILDEIRKYRTEEYLPSDCNPSFSLCLPFPEDILQLKEDCLYVGLLSDVCRSDRNRGKNVIICLRDRPIDHNDKEEFRNLVVVNEDISLMTLISTVQKRFYQVIQWKQRMDDALLAGCNMQELVDLAPPLLENYIQINDASFMKLAQTTAFDCDCPICMNLKQYGYHPEETVERFRKHNLFDVWARLGDKLYYDNDTVVSKYPTLHRVFKYHGNYYAHVVMTCNNAPITQGMKDLFQLFIDDLSLCIERDWETKFSCVHPYDNFFKELLDGTIATEKELTGRASRIGFATFGRFYIIRIIRAHEQNAPLGTLMKEFSIDFPRFKFINYQNSITAFIHDSQKSNQSKTSLLKGLDKFLERFNCYCGISTCFENASGSSSGFRQASLALKYGQEMAGKKNNPVFCTGSRIFFFDDYFPYYFFGGESDPEELWYRSEFHSGLKMLYQKDLRHSTDDLKLLVTYIRHERRNTEVAAFLNMHRNTVIYRIHHIEDFLGIDLNDEQTRNKLYFACFAAEYYGFQD